MGPHALQSGTSNYIIQPVLTLVPQLSLLQLPLVQENNVVINLECVLAYVARTFS